MSKHTRQFPVLAPPSLGNEYLCCPGCSGYTYSKTYCVGCCWAINSVVIELENNKNFEMLERMAVAIMEAAQRARDNI